MADLGELEFGGLISFVFDEAASDVAGEDYGELEYGGLVPVVYEIESAAGGIPIHLFQGVA